MINFILHHFYKYQPSVFQLDSYRFPLIKLTLGGYPIQLHILSITQLSDYNLRLYSIDEL